MKTIFFSLALIFTLASCSSGTSVADIPPNVSASTFTGTYTTSNGLGTGDIILDLNDDGTGNITGNIIVSPTIADICLCSTDVVGVQNGFDLTLDTGDCTITQQPLTCDTPTEVLDPVTMAVIDSFCPEEDFTGPAQIALTGSVNSFSGTFIVNGNVCNAPAFNSINNVNSGTISVSR